MTPPLHRLATALADRYTIERELGQGGMATVFLAHDIKHDRRVAIKVLKPEIAAVLGADRFVVEIKTTAALQHPHILPLFDSGSADGFLFYVMPFIQGETLRAKLDRETQLGIDESVRIARDVADALDYAHRHGVIHRDIKPENILLHDGRPMVADFGIALALSAAAGGRMTETGMSLGTPHYMSPEQATADKEITGRSDIYSLGSVLYEMLAGEPPHVGHSAQQIIMKIIAEDVQPVTRLRKAVPANVAAAVAKSLEKLPADRFESAKAFAEALANPAFRTSEVTTTGAWARAASSRVSRLSFLGLLLISITVGVWGWLRPAPSIAPGLTVTSILAPAGGTFAEQRSLALSPDGRRLAFVFAAADGSRNLWVRGVDRLDAEPVPGSNGAGAPFWSPDGRSLGFFAGGFLSVAEPNGQTRRLCPVADATGGSWSTSGLILFGHRGGISTVPAEGGTCRIVVPRGSGPPLKGGFLPDGKRMLISRGQFTDMIVAGLDGKTLATLPVRTTEFAVVAPGYLLMASQNDIRALDAQRLNLNSLALEGPVVRVANDVRAQAGIHTYGVSSNGVLAFLPGGQDRPYLVYGANGLLRDTIRVDGTWTVSVRPARAGPATAALAGNTVGIWLFDLDSRRGTRVLVHDSTFPTTGFAFGTTHPIFNGDGTHLVYAMRGGSRCRVVDRDLRTSAERVVGKEVSTHSSLNECRFPLDWSSDGRFLLVRQDSTLRIVLEDGTAETLSITRPGRVLDGRFSPDGHFIAYSSDESGRPEVYVQALPSGPPLLVSLEGGRWPAWTHGGRQLTYLTPDGRVQVADITPSGAPAGTPRTLFSIPTWRRSTFDDNGTGFAVVGDGERYLVRQSATGLAVAYLQHWPTILQRADSAAPAARP